jgi:hypothetical protein
MNAPPTTSQGHGSAALRSHMVAYPEGTSRSLGFQMQPEFKNRAQEAREASPYARGGTGLGEERHLSNKAAGKPIEYKDRWSVPAILSILWKRCFEGTGSRAQFIVFAKQTLAP